MNSDHRNRWSFKTTLAISAALSCLLPAYSPILAMETVFWRGTANIEALEPAEIVVSPDIRTILVVNRYRPEGTYGKFLKNLEGFKSQEFAGQDKKGAESAVNAVAEALQKSPRFDVVNPGVEMPGSGTEEMPLPLPAYEVRRLCEEHGADALVAIEAMDSNHKSEPFEKKYGLLNQKSDEWWRMTVDVAFGWRLYDGVSGHMIDEFSGTRSVTIEEDSGRSTTAEVKNLATDAGRIYGKRIAPMPYPVHLSYFLKGTDNLKEGARLARESTWEEAEAVWREDLEAKDLKNRGKAAHNIAVAHEVRGDLDGALMWAGVAAEEYGNKVGWEYYRELPPRIEKQRQAERQLARATPSEAEVDVGLPPVEAAVALEEAIAVDEEGPTDGGDANGGAKVADVSGEMIYLNIGLDEGVEVGDVFEIHAIGKEIVDPDTGESLGSLDELLGIVEVTHVIGPRLSAARPVQGEGFTIGNRAVKVETRVEQ